MGLWKKLFGNNKSRKDKIVHSEKNMDVQNDLLKVHSPKRKANLQNDLLKVHPAERNTNLQNYLLKVHPDIRELLWIADGPGKNYTPSENQNVYEYEGFRVTVSIGTVTEPSLISSRQPITMVNDVSSVERPPYFPTYEQITPEQKGVYWKLLENPYDPSIDIGFVFILYYGLERHLLEGSFERAFDVILKLRDVHRNGSFQDYSAHALILTSLFRQRADLAVKFFSSLDKEYEFNFSDDLYLLCKFGLGIPLTYKDMARMAKTFEFTNTNYIKKYPQIFEGNLRNELIEKYGSDAIDMKRFVSSTEWRRLKKQTVPVFANMSIQNRTVDMPVISDSFKLKNTVYDILKATHETTKKQLAQMRKDGKLPPETKPKTKKKLKKPLVFDKAQERLLLEELEKNTNHIMNRHFTYNSLQDFYYRYRDLNEKYLQKCIDFCMKDIAALPDVQKAYPGIFDGEIPAFYRLAVIYEKRGDYEKAITICDQAIVYYNNVGMIDSATKFTNRREKLVSKSEKRLKEIGKDAR